MGGLVDDTGKIKMKMKMSERNTYGLPTGETGFLRDLLTRHPVHLNEGIGSVEPLRQPVCFSWQGVPIQGLTSSSSSARPQMALAEKDCVPA